jgi:hypothetical protein
MGIVFAIVVIGVVFIAGAGHIDDPNQDDDKNFVTGWNR